MRYAVLSDIHGNLGALTAVLDALASERIDRYVSLGDAIGYGPDPVACLERLRALNAVVVAGNHERACLGALDMGWFNDTAHQAILWTRDRLSFTDLEYLRQMPLTTVVESCTLVHATLSHPERFEYLVDIAQALDTMTVCRTLFCLFGHTHLPCFIAYDRTERRIRQVLSELQELTELPYHDDPTAWRYLVNPGSVGQPRDRDPRASCVIMDTGRRRVSFRRIPYDIAATQHKIYEAGLPAVLADRLAIGR